MLAEVLEPNSSGLMIVWEDVWASRLAAAIRGAGGVILVVSASPTTSWRPFEGIPAS